MSSTDPDAALATLYAQGRRYGAPAEHSLRSADMSEQMLRDEACHLRTLARLSGTLAPHPGLWDGWGVAEIVDVDGLTRAHGLQLGELVLVAPDDGTGARIVHSKIRGQDVTVPRGCVRVVLPPTG